MHWSEIYTPNESVSRYNHTFLKTPLGEMIIEWKSWKTEPSYDLTVNGDYICSESSLDEAKNRAKTHLLEKYNELKIFISKFDF